MNNKEPKILYIGSLNDHHRVRIESAEPGLVLHHARNPAAVGEIISEVEVVAAPMVYFPRDLYLRLKN